MNFLRFICISLLMLALTVRADSQSVTPPDGVSVRFIDKTDEVEFKGKQPLPEGAAKLFIGNFCAKESDPTIYFKIGNQVFAAPKQQLSKGLLRGVLKEMNFSTDSQGSTTIIIPRLWGCESHPVPYAMLDIEPSEDNSLKWVILSETPEGSRLVEYIQHLAKNGACRATTSAGLPACFGSKTLDNGDKVNLAFYLVMQDASADSHATITAPSGIPIHARCEEYQGQVHCTVSDDIDNKVTVKTEISEKDLNRETVLQLWEKLTAYANSIRFPKAP